MVSMTQPLDTPQVIFLGQGQLSWLEAEQKSGRYGSVALYWSMAHPPLLMPKATHLVGIRGKLRAIVLQHKVRKLHPGISAPIGTIVELGIGTVFVEVDSTIGLQPSPLRELHWLDPAKLLSCAEQEVRLELSLLDMLFEPMP